MLGNHGVRHHHPDTKKLLSEIGKTHPGNMTGHKQSTEWSENKSKEMTGNQYAKGVKHTDEWRKTQSERKKGKPLSAEHNAATTKAKMQPVLQFSKTGEFIQEWPSSKEASESLEIARSLISRVIKNGMNAGGFKFKKKQSNDERHSPSRQ